MQINEEQLRSIKLGQPLHLSCDDGDFVVLSAETFDRLKELMGLSPAEAYPLADEAFRENWDAPGMADYDDYESRKLA